MLQYEEPGDQLKPPPPPPVPSRGVPVCYSISLLLNVSS